MIGTNTTNDDTNINIILSFFHTSKVIDYELVFKTWFNIGCMNIINIFFVFFVFSCTKFSIQSVVRF